MNLYENIYSNDILKRKLISVPSEETSKFFSASYLAVKDFLKYLRKYPEIMYKIIKSADKKFFTYHFNYFIINNFFEDILFPHNISNEFIYLIELLLKDLISNIDNPIDFVKKYENSNLFYLINGLIYKKEIKIYFNSIISNVIEDYSSSGKSSKVLLFEVGELNNFIKNRDINCKSLMRKSDLTKNKEKEIKLEKKEYVDSLNNIFRMRFNSYENSSIDSLYNFEEEVLSAKNSEENEEFVRKYLQELNKGDLKKIIQNKHNKDNRLKEYIQYQLLNMSKNDNLFSNNVFLEKVQKSKESEKILYFYGRNFVIVINIINQILELIQINICLIPPIIKNILKIFVDTLKIKFPNIKNFELYINVATLLIKLINNCFSKIEYNSLISSTLFSSRIKRNMNVIISIFSDLFSLKLYKSEEKSDYTPFNLYFLDKFNILFDIFEKLLDFNKSTKKFPFIHNKIVNIDNNISYTKDKLFSSISICYNVEDITNLLNIIKHNLDYILEKQSSYPVKEFRIIYEKLRDNKEIFKFLKEKDISTINYYYLFEIDFYNPNDNIIKKSLCPIFKIENEEKKLSKKDKNKSEFISAQNLLSELLMNITELDTIEISNSNNLKHILNDISLYLQHKYNIMDNFFFSEGEHKMQVPLEWYITSFSKLLEKVDSKYNKKEYEKFLSKFKKYIENSIEEYKFLYIEQLSHSLNTIKKCKEEHKEMQKILGKISINNQIVDFINNEIIEVEIKFKYDEKEKYLNINKKNKNSVNDSNIIFDNTKICYNILEFIQNFPDLNFIQKIYNINLFDIEKKINVGESLNYYFHILNKCIIQKFNEKIRDEVLIKTKKYIFEKIYSKTFPKYKENNDLIIIKKISSLSWVKPEHFNLYDFDFDSIISITTGYFKQINKQHSPIDKLNIIHKLFEIIFNALKYIKGENFTNEDISNICLYIIIKSKPEKLYSNLKYLEIFENKNMLDNSQIYLKELKEGYDNILKLNYESFKGMSEDDYNNKCKLDYDIKNK